VAHRLDREGAAQAAAALTQALTRTTDPLTVGEVAWGLSAVACRLDCEGAARHYGLATSALTQAMSKTTSLDSQRVLGELLSATLTGDPRHPATRSAGLVVGVGPVLPGQPLLAPIAHLPSLMALPCRLDTLQLVDLLKHPLCVGQARRVVLDQLENRYHREFADQWAFVRFATEHLGLVFTPPPRRPEATAPETRR